MSPDLDWEPVSVALEDLDAAASVVRDRDQELHLTRALDECVEVLLYSLPLVRRGRRQQWVDEREDAVGDEGEARDVLAPDVLASTPGAECSSDGFPKRSG